MNCPVLSLVLHLNHEASVLVFLILETVPHSDPRPKEAVHSHIHRISLPVRRQGVQLVHARLTHCIHPEIITCHTDVALVCRQQVDYERSAASTMFSQRLVLNVQNVQNAALRASEIRILPHELRKRRSLPFCTTSGVRRVV